jgi:hypothetical protein
LPSEQKKVVTAQRAPVRLKKPVDSFLHGVADAYTSKIDRFAVWTVREVFWSGADHDIP